MKARLYSYFRWCGYFWDPWVSLVKTDKFSVRVIKFSWRYGVPWTHSLNLFLTYLNLMNYGHFIACEPDNFELHNSLKLSFPNILGLCPNFVDCKSFLESNSPEILAVCETNLDKSIDSGNFWVRGYLPLIQKVLICMVLQLWRKEFLLHGLISIKLCRLLLMFLTGFTSHSVLLLFLLSITFFVCVQFSDSISSNIYEVLSINPSASVFLFEEFNVHCKDWLTYPGGTDRSGELCYNFSISSNLTQIVSFPTQIPDCDFHSPALLNSIFTRC